ncbi:MAG: NADH dehydrogenase subunit [Bdellovibrio sp.]|nr:MAG: NADH dehydrogenase subunit [Bdellovibrio sp.]
MLKCKINGVEVEVKEGTTIIEAFKIAGQKIAHYCWHPGLSVAGVCRLCMVEIKGQPRLQIACNTPVQDGMEITNQSEQVKETVRWGLDFHLINHPLDCPICDQAGECGLQDQYMEFGLYTPEMAEPKVKKHKVVDLGSKIVLDTERCILCSRCVRFTAEVTKTYELGIFNRGDRSEIGTFENKPLENNYALNTVDICPVGALTSKDFRFRQRVWYLQERESICTGCSTGCNIKIYFNEEGLFRIRPVYNEKVNGYWMCDEGRNIYKFVNKENRLLKAKKGRKGEWLEMEGGAAAKDVAHHFKSLDKERIALVVTGQFSNEEYEALFQFYKKNVGNDFVYHWINNKESFEDFDGLLLRGDRNPNTKGLLQKLEDYRYEQTWAHLEENLKAGKIETLIVAGPENPLWFPDLKEKVQQWGIQLSHLIWLSSAKVQAVDEVECLTWQIPLKTFFEKDGTYVNYQGLEQKSHRIATIVPGALSLSEAAHLMAGEEYKVDMAPILKGPKKNYYVHRRGYL